MLMEYRCPQGHSQERLERTHEAVATAPRRIHCNHCRCFATQVEFPTTGAPQFKGSGWTAKGSGK